MNGRWEFSILTANDVECAAFEKRHDVGFAGIGRLEDLVPLLRQDVGISVVNVRVGIEYVEMEGRCQ